MTAEPKRGQATLSLVLLIGGIASAIVIAIALVSVSLVGSGFGQDASQRARAAALAGVEDVALRFSRGPAQSESYVLTSGAVTVGVEVYPDIPSVGFASVLSSATVGVRSSNLYATFSFDPLTQIPTLVSIEDQ